MITLILIPCLYSTLESVKASILGDKYKGDLGRKRENGKVVLTHSSDSVAVQT